MSSTVNEFSKDFIEYSIIFMIDYYSEYFQLLFDKESRDYIAFLTDLEFVRNIRLSQDWINSVSIFQWIIYKVYYHQISHYTRFFINDMNFNDLKK